MFLFLFVSGFVISNLVIILYSFFSILINFVFSDYYKALKKNSLILKIIN